MTANALHLLPLFLYYSNENTIQPFIMKRLLSTVLLAYLVLGAWAQNKTKMTEEEKKEQAELRKEYIATIKMNLRNQLDNIDVKEADGTVVNLGERYGRKKTH